VVGVITPVLSHEGCPAFPHDGTVVVVLPPPPEGVVVVVVEPVPEQYPVGVSHGSSDGPGLGVHGSSGLT